MKKTVEEYLARGFSRPYAEYFASGHKRITAVKANDDYTLTLTFDDGEKRRLDMRADLREGVFQKIADLKDFKRVYLNEDHTVCWDIDPKVDSRVVWNNQIDICPDTCYVESVPITMEN